MLVLLSRRRSKAGEVILISETQSRATHALIMGFSFSALARAKGRTKGVNKGSSEERRSTCRRGRDRACTRIDPPGRGLTMSPPGVKRASVKRCSSPPRILDCWQRVLFLRERERERERERKVPAIVSVASVVSICPRYAPFYYRLRFEKGAIRPFVDPICRARRGACGALFIYY